MASYGMLSKGISVIGISPESEAEKSNLPIRLVQGVYLSETDDGILVGEGFCRYLRVNLGDTIALLGQGFRGSTAVGLFPIRGILKLPLTDMDNGLAYISLPAAQDFIDMPDGYSGVLIALKNAGRLNQTVDEVKTELIINAAHSDYEVFSWHYTMKDLLRTAEMDKAFSKIILFILYLIVGFGILGTVIMMTNERRREFGILISLGMHRGLLKLVITVELLLMASCGALSSLMLTIPIVWWFHTHPIRLSGDMAAMYADYGMEPVMPMSSDPIIFLIQITIVFVLACITLIYPYSVIGKLKVTAKE
jgi:ABC-type lipoprotein release transport system permease subunit